ncbi:MAG: hypothetical protein U1G07_00145 [Verrucomicrobiota bacterium]
MAAPDLLLNNFRWKLTALLLALLLWFVIKFAIYKEITGGRPQVLRHLPVMLLKAPDDARTFRIEPLYVDVIVQSTKELSGEDLEVFLDLTKIPDVASTFKPVQVRAAEATRIIRTDPTFVMVEPMASADSGELNSPRK